MWTIWVLYHEASSFWKLKNVTFHLISSRSQGVRQYFDCYILVAMRGRIPIRSYTSIMHSAILYYFTQKVYRNRVQDYAQENMRVFIETTCWAFVYSQVLSNSLERVHGFVVAEPGGPWHPTFALRQLENILISDFSYKSYAGHPSFYRTALGVNTCMHNIKIYGIGQKSYPHGPIVQIVCYHVWCLGRQIFCL